MRLSSRRYGASVGGRDGSNDIRLHGRPPGVQRWLRGALSEDKKRGTAKSTEFGPILCMLMYIYIYMLHIAKQ